MRTIYFLLLSFVPAFAMAQNLCFGEAAKIAGVDRDLIVAIAKHESGFDPRIVHYNKNGSRDIGILQINSVHLPELQLAGFVEADLYDGCTNMQIGAVYLKEAIRRNGNTWRAVGTYNASSEAKRVAYVNKISAEYFKLKEKRERARKS